MKKIAVTFVASTFNVGGSERVLSHLITRLPEKRFRVRLCFLKDAGSVGRELFQCGIRGMENFQRLRFDPMAALRLARHFRHTEPDILFILDHHNAMLWGRVAGLLANVGRQVVASHATGLFGGSKNFRISDRWLMEVTDRVVALSRAHEHYLVQTEGIEPSRITIIENGIPVHEFESVGDGSGDTVRRQLGITSQQQVVTIVAALRPEKAHELFLEAARLLVVSGRSLKFLIVGDGPRRKQLEDVCASMGLENDVLFLGSRRDVNRLLQVSDVVTLPSHPAVETLPLSVMEAMAAGVPVVATRVGSLPEMIQHGLSGLLIQPGHPEQLAEAVALLLDNPEKARGMAVEAKKTVHRRYSVDNMVDQYISLFESLMEQ